MTVELEVRVEDVKWCRNVSPRGFPNKTTFCATFCVQKEEGYFEKGFVTPAFMVDLPAPSRLIVWKIAIEIREDGPSDAEPGDLLRYAGVLDIVKIEGPSIMHLKRQLRDWIKFSDCDFKLTVAKKWVDRLLCDLEMTEKEHKAKTLAERRSLWASHDWTQYHRMVQLCADGAWLTADTLGELMGVCRLERTAVLPVYWEQRGIDTAPCLNRETPVGLTQHNPWKPLGWSVCKPFDSTSPYAFWSKFAAVCGLPPPKHADSFEALGDKMTKIGDVSFWAHWKPQWDLFFDEWLDSGGIESGGATLDAPNCRTLISMVGSSDAFLYEWEGPKDQTTIITTNPQRAYALASLNMHVVVINLNGFFCEYGEPVKIAAKGPQTPGIVRITASRPHYVFFDSAENWTITHGHQALEVIKRRFGGQDTRIGALWTQQDDTLVRWDNDASPRILAILMGFAGGDTCYHACKHSDRGKPGVARRFAAWKELKGVYVAETPEVLQDQVSAFLCEKKHPLFVCERGKQIATVRSALYDTTSNTKISIGERVYLFDLDMYGIVTTFQPQSRAVKPTRVDKASAGMLGYKAYDVGVKIGDNVLYFDLGTFLMRKASVVSTTSLSGHTGATLFVLSDDWWVKAENFETFLSLVDPQTAYLVGSSRRLATLLLD